MSYAKKRNSTILMLASLMFAALPGHRASAATLEVGTCALNGIQGQVSGQFTTIQAAVNAAPPNSTVLVCPGTYPEQVTITQSLKLRGVSSGNAGATVVVPPPTGLAVLPGTSTAPQILVSGGDLSFRVEISDLTVDGSNNQVTDCSSPTFIEGVYFLNADGTIENVVARNQNVTVNGSLCGTGIGLRVTATRLGSAVTIQNNTVSGYDFAGIFASYPLAQVTIRNNSILGPGPLSLSTAGITLFNDVMATVSGNSIVDNPSAAAYQMGIAVVGVHNAVISKNHFGNNGYGVAFYTFSGDPNSDNGTVTGNEVFGGEGDGIAICGSNNLVAGNSVSNNSESGVNLTTFDGQCAANNNTVSANTISGACTGALVDPAASGNTIGSDNRMFNTSYLQTVGTVCPAVQRTQKASPPGDRLSHLEP